MDLLDPSVEPLKELTEQNLNEVSDTAADTGIENVAETLESQTETRVVSVESLLSDARELLKKDAAEIGGDEIRRLRQLYASLNKPEASDVEAEQEGDAVQQPEINAELESVLEQLKEKKAAWANEQEALRAANLDRKNAIIEEIIALADDTDNVNRTFPRYRELQDEFNAIGDVDPAHETALWKRFQDAREKYSDNLKINKELRDYDFKKNLTEKEALLEQARELAGIEDVISAYRQLQDLHNKWRQIGPVAKELREEIWNNFREASADVNKRYQAFFEARKAREAENEAAKTQLCEKIEAIDFTALKSFAAWDEATHNLQDLQEEWRKLGFASRKMNRQLFARFRERCDAFFAAKAEFYRSIREELASNLSKKQQLVEKAESLKDSTDWRKATEVFVELQKEWKTIGAVPKKFSDDLWTRFTTACDYFFDRKKKAGSGTRQVETANLKAKRDVIGQLSALSTEETVEKEAAIAELRKLQAQWQEIGHVPFREKDKLYEAYRAAVDAVRNRFAIAESKARREKFEAAVAEIEGDDNKLFRERERLMRALETRRADLRTYQNNLGFLSSKSKSGDTLIRDLERRIERLKTDITELEEKIRHIDSKIS
ncbi:MAG: DUF349 domain-containing protein [Muribaculaceae bacterium]|nr:DUF349 domain-containing protein [Muribaculaceae bacterium]